MILDPKVGADPQRAKPIHEADGRVNIAIYVVAPSEVLVVEVEMILKKKIRRLASQAQAALRWLQQ